MFRMNCNKIKTIAGIVAAAAVLLPCAAFAQDAATGPDSIPTVTLTPQTDGSINYTALLDPTLKYSDLMRAKVYGLSEDQIAGVYNVANFAEVPFSEVFDHVQSGWTIPSAAQYYGVPLRVASDSDRSKAHIADYEMAYQATGVWGWKKYHGGDMMMRHDMMPGTHDNMKPMHREMHKKAMMKHNMTTNGANPATNK